MQPEIPRQNNIDTRTAVNRRNAVEIQGGPAHRYVAFDPDQFCKFIDNDTSPNWECAICGRRLAKKLTNGKKPVVMCLNPTPADPTKKNNIMPVVVQPSKAGEIVKRVHRGAPQYGVGFELRRVLHRIDIELPPRCVCNSRAMLLNDVGIDGVEKMRHKVLQWFEEEANKRALPYSEKKANKILDIAIRRARKIELKLAPKNPPADNG